MPILEQLVMTFARVAASVAICIGFFTQSSVGAVIYKATLLSLVGDRQATAAGVFGNTQAGYTNPANGEFRAVLWNGTAASRIDLHPSSGFDDSQVFAVGENSQGGLGRFANLNAHALLWRGTAASVVDIHPPGFVSSEVTAIFGDRQIGTGGGAASGGPVHALLWRGSATSAIDLHPTGFDRTFGWGLSDTYQVGSGYGPATGGQEHALLWSGTGSSVVDLNSSGFDYSKAVGVIGATQFGHGSGAVTGNDIHALRWMGTAASVVDFHPGGFQSSYITSAAGAHQAGIGVLPTGESHALLWNGSPDSVIDLHSTVAGMSQMFVRSTASGVDASGNVVGTARTASGITFAVMWSPVPEPATSGLFCLGMVVATLARRSRRLRVF